MGYPIDVENMKFTVETVESFYLPNEQRSGEWGEGWTGSSSKYEIYCPNDRELVCYWINQKCIDI